MAQTLQQLRSRTLDFIRETSDDSHFTPDQLAGYLNQAQEYIAAVSSPPEDLVSVAVEVNKGAYLLPSDNLVITSAYFGDSSIANDVRPLTVISKTNAKHMFPNWLDETTGSQGQPTHLWHTDNSTIWIHRRPSSQHAGKRLYLYYGFTPSPMTADGDVPDIKANYHLLLPIFAASLAYYTLSNAEIAKEMMALFQKQYSAIKDTVEKEAEENFSFKWGVTE